MSSDKKSKKIHTLTMGMFVFEKTFTDVFTSLLVVDFDARLAGVDKELHSLIIKEFLVSEIKQINNRDKKGKIEYVYLNCVKSILILENKNTSNKKWFKCLIHFSKVGKIHGYHQPKIVYLYLTSDHIKMFKERENFK